MLESSKRNSTAPKTILDLPSDTLLQILSLLDKDDLQSISLVSKSFLVLSNHCVRKLTFKALPNDSTFRKIFTRFSSVKGIVIHSTRIARALTAISNSNLNLEALKIVGRPAYPSQQHMLSLAGRLKIKSLAFDWFSKVRIDKIIEFIQLFPALEALHFDVHFGFHVELKDAEVESLSLAVPNLRKIDFSLNNHLTDRALYALSANCVNLEYIGMGRCYYNFTPEGFCNFLLKCRNLKYLEVPFFLKFPESALLLAEAVSACENLHHLSIRSTLMRDDMLVTIAKSRASLKSLQMTVYDSEPNSGFTMTGLSAILCAFQSLTRLHISLPPPESDNFLDKKMSKLVKSLPCLNNIFISSYCPIYTTLFSLIENCPLLEWIYLWMNLPAPDQHYTVHMPQLIRKNYTVKHITIVPRPVDSFKIALGSFCPSLKKSNGRTPMDTFFPNNPALDWM
ncbi:hypothetical protein QQ045_020413 [Rhodiola kirilowii]